MNFFNSDISEDAICMNRVHTYHTSSTPSPPSEPSSTSIASGLSTAFVGVISYLKWKSLKRHIPLSLRPCPKHAARLDGRIVCQRLANVCEEQHARYFFFFFEKNVHYDLLHWPLILNRCYRPRILVRYYLTGHISLKQTD